MTSYRLASDIFRACSVSGKLYDVCNLIEPNEYALLMFEIHLFISHHTERVSRYMTIANDPIVDVVSRCFIRQRFDQSESIGLGLFIKLHGKIKDNRSHAAAALRMMDLLRFTCDTLLDADGQHDTLHLLDKYVSHLIYSKALGKDYAAANKQKADSIALLFRRVDVACGRSFVFPSAVNGIDIEASQDDTHSPVTINVSIVGHHGPRDASCIWQLMTRRRSRGECDSDTVVAVGMMVIRQKRNTDPVRPRATALREFRGLAESSDTVHVSFRNDPTNVVDREYVATVHVIGHNCCDSNDGARDCCNSNDGEVKLSVSFKQPSTDVQKLGPEFTCLDNARVEMIKVLRVAKNEWTDGSSISMRNNIEHHASRLLLRGCDIKEYKKKMNTGGLYFTDYFIEHVLRKQFPVHALTRDLSLALQTQPSRAGCHNVALFYMPNHMRHHSGEQALSNRGTLRSIAEKGFGEKFYGKINLVDVTLPPIIMLGLTAVNKLHEYYSEIFWMERRRMIDETTHAVFTNYVAYARYVNFIYWASSKCCIDEPRYIRHAVPPYLTPAAILQRFKVNR